MMVVDGCLGMWWYDGGWLLLNDVFCVSSSDDRTCNGCTKLATDE